MAETLRNLTESIMCDSVSYVGSAHIRFHRALHLRPRPVEHHRFLLVESGRGVFQFTDQSLSIDGRTLLLLSPGRRETRYEATEPVSYLYIEFESERRLIEGAYLNVPTGSRHFATLAGLVRSIVREKGALECLLPAAVELALAPPSRSGTLTIDPRIQRALQYVDQNLNRLVTVSELARQAGLSVPHFRRLFRDVTGSAPKDFLLRGAYAAREADPADRRSAGRRSGRSSRIRNGVSVLQSVQAVVQAQSL